RLKEEGDEKETGINNRVAFAQLGKCAMNDDPDSCIRLADNVSDVLHRQVGMVSEQDNLPLFVRQIRKQLLDFLSSDPPHETRTGIAIALQDIFHYFQING